MELWTNEFALIPWANEKIDSNCEPMKTRNYGTDNCSAVCCFSFLDALSHGQQDGISTAESFTRTVH